jgi:GxxExxY protein
MIDLILKDETYKIIGACIEVHKTLGRGHSEVIYKDALEIEFYNRQIPFSREQKFDVYYKGILLPHHYYADFVVFNAIILEVKAIECLTSGHLKQTLNYLAVSKLKLGMLVNFGEDSLKHKRVIL